MASLAQITTHVEQLLACTSCPKMVGPVVSGRPVLSPVMMIGQAPGSHEGPAGKPFAWTAGKTLFKWYGQAGLDEEQVRARVYMAAVCRCYPGRGAKTGDRVPEADEIAACGRHLAAEVKLLKPKLVIPVGKLAIAQLFPEQPQLADVVGPVKRTRWHGHDVDVIALPHPSGLSTWFRTEPGKTLLGQALRNLGKHPAWASLVTS